MSARASRLLLLGLLGLTAVILERGARASELTLYFYPSPHGINWQSPRSLARSVVDNALSRGAGLTNKHEIGHVSIALRCDGAAPIQTGMTEATDTADTDLLLKQRVGLGILFHVFEGRLQTEAEIERDLAERFDRGLTSWLTVEISAAACQRLTRYYDEYRARGLDRYYGLPLRPLYGEGAGCSAFAASFLETAGLMTDEYRGAWSSTVKVPENLIAGPPGPAHVGLFSLLFSRLGRHWAHPDEPGRPIFFWDPDRMHHWLVGTWTRERARPSGLYRLEQRERSLGLVLDDTQVPTPTGSIFKD